MRMLHHLIGDGVSHAEMHESHHGQDQQYIAKQEPTGLSPEKESFDQPYIINVEDRHEAERYDDATHVIFYRADA